MSAISCSGVGLGGCLDFGLVDLLPVRRWSIRPISVSSTTLICSCTRLDVRLGHPWEKPASIALHNVDTTGLAMVA